MKTAELYCNAERRVVGTVTGEPGAVITAASVRAGFSPALPEYAGLDARAVDGVGLLCPRCGNPLLFRQPDVPGESPRGLYAVPGAIRFY